MKESEREREKRKEDEKRRFYLSPTLSPSSLERGGGGGELLNKLESPAT